MIKGEIMLDAKVNNNFVIAAKLPDKKIDNNKVLLIKECKLYICDVDRIYSELEEQTFSVQNSNDGIGMLDVEFILDNSITDNKYPQFYTKCFVIRTNNGLKIKPMKFRNDPASSKVNQNGDLIIGIRYYFRDKSDIGKLMSCENVLIEGFIAFDKVNNVYGVTCQLQKIGDKWEITTAYTYKPKYAKNIKNLID